MSIYDFLMLKKFSPVATHSTCFSAGIVFPCISRQLSDNVDIVSAWNYR